MTGRAHGLIGAGLGTLGAAHGPDDTLLRLAIFAVTVVTALLMDIDHPKAIISGYLPVVGHAARLLISHRGPTHTAGFVALVMGLLLIVGAPTTIIFAAGAGLLSHLVADMLTPQGVPLLMPLSRRAFMLGPRFALSMTSWALEAVATVGALGVIGLVIGGKL